MIDFDTALRHELARRIYDLDVYGARDNDETPETIEHLIIHDPISIINYLVEMVEELQA